MSQSSTSAISSRKYMVGKWLSTIAYTPPAAYQSQFHQFTVTIISSTSQVDKKQQYQYRNRVPYCISAQMFFVLFIEILLSSPRSKLVHPSVLLDVFD
jgi:hypothetical protein